MVKQSSQFGVQSIMLVTIACLSLRLVNIQQQNRLALGKLHEELKQVIAQQQNIKQQLKSELNVSGPEKKFFMEDILEGFNVKPLHALRFEKKDGTFDFMMSHDATNDSYYTKETIKNAQKFGNFLDNPKFGSRQTYVKWSCKEMGYGMFANIDLPKGTFVGEYTGLVQKDHPASDYVWNYPAEDEGEYIYGIDGRVEGNLLRFANHVEDNINLETAYFVHDGVWHIGYVTTQTVKKDQELFVHYGYSYWASRNQYDPVAEDYIKREETEEAEDSTDYDENDWE